MGGVLAVHFLNDSADPIRAENTYVLGGFPGFFLGCGVLWLISIASSGLNFETLRGRTLLSHKQAAKKARRAIAKLPKAQRNGPQVAWGGLTLPSELFRGHFCVAGSTGSGKTVLLTHLMNSVLPRISAQSDMRALIYDAKTDVYSLLMKLGVPEKHVILLNPFDARSAPWDMAEDVQESGVAYQIASILIPPQEGPNKYFSDAAAAIVTGVIQSFILTAPKDAEERRKRAWTFRDLLVACQTEQALRAVLSRTKYTAVLIRQFFNQGTTFENIKSTIASNTSILQPIAALWAHSRKAPVSLSKWTTENRILVLGNDDTLRAQIDAVNRVLFQRITELLLGQTGSKTRESWVFLDELKEAGSLSGLQRLLTKGRDRGVRVVIGFQDFDGLAQVYKYEGANEITGMCVNKALLRMDGPQTARWAAEVIAETEVREMTSGTSVGESISTNTSEHIRGRYPVLAAEIMNLPLPDERGLKGYALVPTIGLYSLAVGYPDYSNLEERDHALDFVRRDPREQYLDPWDDGDLKRLGLTGLITPSTPETPSPPSAASPLDDIPRLEPRPG